MGLLDIGRSLDRRLSGYVKNQRALTLEQAWRQDIDYSPAAGRRVTIDTALTLPVVLRAFTLMVGDIGPLPIDTYRRVDRQRVPIEPPPWVETPDPANLNRRRPEFISQCVASLLADGNLFVRAYPDRFSTQWVRVFDPFKVTVETDADGVDWYRAGGVRLSAAEVVHVPWLVLGGKSRGEGPVSLLKESISSGLAAIDFGASFFANGSVMGGMVEVPDGVRVDPEELKKQMERNHRGARKSHAIGVLTGGATFREVTYNARDSQLLELQQFIVEDVGRAFGIPPYLLGSQEPGAVAYASTSNARIDYVQHGIQPIVTRIEQAFSTLIPGDDTFLRFNIDALLRGDQKARYEAYHVLLQDRVITRDEVRNKEDWGPADEAEGVDSENGGYLDTPQNTAPVKPEPAPVAEPPAQRTEPVNITVNAPPVNVSSPPVSVTSYVTPEAQEKAERAADMVVTDTRERLDLMEVAVVESNQQTRDYVDTRVSRIEERFIAAEEERREAMARLSAIPPVTREPKRDGKGRIVSVTETRGDKVIHKRIDRDEHGQIIRVVEVAA